MIGLNTEKVIGLGIDIVSLRRIDDIITRQGERFAKRILHESEFLNIQTELGNLVCFLAGRWAAKEAIAKALGSGFRGFNFNDIAIINDFLGKPIVNLHNGALKRAKEQNITKVLISISHEREWAVAEALAISEEGKNGISVVYANSLVDEIMEGRCIMAKPLIGISPSFQDRDRNYNIAETYIESVKKAGGIPILIPHDIEDAVQLVERIDGLLISGGPDVDPIYFNEQPWPKLGAVTPERDQSEIALLHAALTRGIPILGICRGCQILNIVKGGSLYQDLYSQYDNSEGKLLKHGQEGPRWYTSHKVALTQGSKLATILALDEVAVNSFHHQAIKNVGEGLVISAIAPDGVIEAIEDPHHKFCVGVQWHPECMFSLQTAFDNLFKAFIDACHA